MKRVINIAILINIASLFVTNISCAQKMQQNNNVTVVFQKSYSDNIINFSLDTITANSAELEKIGWSVDKQTNSKQSLCPRVILTEDDKGQPKEIQFYGPKGNIINKYLVGKNKVEFSPQGKYILKYDPYDEYKAKGGGATLYNLNGDIVWQNNTGYFKHISDHGYAAIGFISPSGDAVPFSIYDPQGILIKTISLPREAGAAGCSFSEDGTKLIIIYSTRGPEETGLIIINVKDGSIQYDKKISGSILPWECYYIDNVGLVLRSVSTKTDSVNILYIDLKGVMRWSLPIETKRSLIFGFEEDKNQIFFYSRAEGNLVYIDIKSGKIVSNVIIGPGLIVKGGMFWNINGNTIRAMSVKK